MPSERPYPGQLWKHDSMHVMVVAVHPNTVTYEFLSGGQSVSGPGQPCRITSWELGCYLHPPFLTGARPCWL